MKCECAPFNSCLVQQQHQLLQHQTNSDSNVRCCCCLVDARRRSRRLLVRSCCRLFALQAAAAAAALAFACSWSCFSCFASHWALCAQSLQKRENLRKLVEFWQSSTTATGQLRCCCCSLVGFKLNKQREKKEREKSALMLHLVRKSPHRIKSSVFSEQNQHNAQTHTQVAPPKLMIELTSSEALRLL